MAGIQKVRANGLDIAYRIEGPQEAPPVLLVHGIQTDHQIWDDVVARLVPRFRVVRYDLRGHGASSAPSGPYTMAQLADDVPALLDALQIRKVHFIGSSLGGMIGQQVGARHGDRLLTLTLANTAAVQGAPAAWEQRIATARSQGLAALAEPTMERWFTSRFRQSNALEIERLKAILVRTSVEGFAGCAMAVRDLAQLDLLSRIQVPTLVVVGSEDAATPPEAGRRIADAIAGARLVTIDAAHQSAAEQPEAFCAAWLRFVEGDRA